MGMWTTENQDTFRDVLTAFVEASRKNYDYAYSAGYLQSLCVEMIALLPKRKQKEFIDHMISSAHAQEEKLIKKMNATTITN